MPGPFATVLGWLGKNLNGLGGRKRLRDGDAPAAQRPAAAAEGGEPPRRRPRRMAACQSCTMRMSVDRGVKFSAECSCITCRGCARQFLDAAVKASAKMAELTCYCQQRVELVCIQSICQGGGTGPDLLERIGRLMTTQALADDRSFVHCTAPGCGGAQVHDDEEREMMVCHSCRNVTCAKCQVPWHYGLTCEQYQQQQGAPGGGPAAVLETGAKQCPNCQVPVSKDAAGCDLMTCTRCHVKFCWQCLCDMEAVLAPRTGGNHHHKADCPHYRAREPPAQPPAM